MNIILGIPAPKAITFGRIPFPPREKTCAYRAGPSTYQ
jgi:hypothetical protein